MIKPIFELAWFEQENFFKTVNECHAHTKLFCWLGNYKKIEETFLLKEDLELSGFPQNLMRVT